jgi:hypothetical protein
MFSNVFNIYKMNIIQIQNVSEEQKNSTAKYCLTLKGKKYEIGLYRQ